jgi:NAD(P)-dependent dehydrogenase (short-subunit alcohol dehydrogenase family)
MELGLKGKAGIITGASGGIGSCIARELAREGSQLMLTGRDAGRLGATAGDVAGLGALAEIHPADLRDLEASRGLVAATVAAYGRLDFVVANAGSARMGDFLELSAEDWAEGFGLKLFGHVALLQAAWPELVKSGGAVVFIAGAAGRTPNATGIITGCVNAAVLNLTKSLASRGIADGVRVNAVNPGMTRTERFEARVQKIVDARGISRAEAEKHMVSDSQIIRVGEPEEIAAVVAFLVGDRAGFVHGAVVDVDGGKTKTL